LLLLPLLAEEKGRQRAATICMLVEGDNPGLLPVKLVLVLALLEAIPRTTL